MWTTNPGTSAAWGSDWSVIDALLAGDSLTSHSVDKSNYKSAFCYQLWVEVDWTAGGGGGTFTVNGSGSASSEDNVTLVGNLIIQDSASAASADNLALTQASGLLAIADSASLSSADTDTLVQNLNLVIQDSASLSTADNVALIGNLIVADSASVSSADNDVLARNGGDFAIADSSSLSAADNVALIGNLVIADSASLASADNVTVARNGGDLTVADSASVSTADNVSLVGNLIVADSASLATSDNVTVVRNGGDLAVSDSASASSADNLALVGNLIVQDATSLATADNDVIARNGGDLTIADSASLSYADIMALIGNLAIQDSASLSLADNVVVFRNGGDLAVNVKHRDMEASSISCYAVLSDFEKIQNIEIADGRYLNASELDGGSNTVVIGDEVRKALFQTSISPLGQTISFLGKQFIIVGVLKKSGQNMAGFNFDNCVMFSYYTAASVIDVKALDNDPLLAVKGAKGRNIDEVKYEVEGVLRRIRKVKPGQGNNFAINQLSEISKTIESLFGTINVIGGGIAILSLIVGSFGIANIMFVTVKERTKIIGLKKAIGARKSSILLEFLVEAIVLCVIGGLTGIVIVLLLSVLSTYVFGFEVILSFYNFFLGIFVSIVVGILSGIIPAWSASRLDPVVAIRSN